MKLILNSFYTLALLTFLGCGPNAEEKKQQSSQVLSEQIPGTWQITYMSVNIESYQSVGRDSLFEAREETWENQFQVKPFRMFFDKDKKYHQNMSLKSSEGPWDSVYWTWYTKNSVDLKNEKLFVK